MSEIIMEKLRAAPSIAMLASLLVGATLAFQPAPRSLGRGASALRAPCAASPFRHAAVAASPRAASSLMSSQSPYESWPKYLRPDTNGGAIGLTTLSVVLPLIIYSLLVQYSGIDSIRVGQIFIVGYVGIGTVAWTLSYVLRVATKDTTYAQQLKDYESAVLEKRLEELDESEIEALMAEVDKEEVS